MTRGQYLALCLTAAVAVVAFLQSYEVARRLNGTPLGRPVPTTI